MTSRVDRIVGMIDEALDGTPTAPVYDKAATCWRCAAPASDEVCAGCRAFLLGDATHDPRAAVSERQEFPYRLCEIAGCPGVRVAGNAFCSRHATGTVADIVAEAEHAGYRHGMATAVAYPHELPPDPDAGTEVLFIAATRVIHRKWWGPDPAPAPHRYRIAVLAGIGELLIYEFDLAGALWRPDGRRRVVYIRSH